MLTTSYKLEGLISLIRGFIEFLKPKTAVELGTQQGHSAIVIANAMGSGCLFTYDKFEPKYDLPPYGETHASYEDAIKNIRENVLSDTQVLVCKANAFDVCVNFDRIDLLHIDICNHYDNVVPLFEQWKLKVNKLMILEGGGYNYWQKEYGFKSYRGWLCDNEELHNLYQAITFGDEDHAVTFLCRKGISK